MLASRATCTDERDLIALSNAISELGELTVRMRTALFAATQLTLAVPIHRLRAILSQLANAN